jgi:hypothetical protein
MRLRKTPEELRKLQELRRSNAASFVPNKKNYTRQSNKKMIELSKKERDEQ